jgi:FkbM family methyltransferase
MSFVSYAQNFEDVMLWRALKHVQGGFYIDVGANDPSADSVTKAFYDRGWFGINIEPLPAHYADLLRERGRDINLQCAVGAASGEIDIWSCDVRGWATAASDVIARHSLSGRSGEFHKVPLLRLSDVCEQYASGEIHFLKIDVEGFEKAVIEGMDFSRYRPWILVVEATRPNTAEENHEEWEGDVISAGYTFAYGDGINRFYVANEHVELMEKLRYPPNVFDEFIRSEQLDLELRVQQAEAQAQLAETKAQQAEAQAQLAETKAQQAEAQAQLAETKAQQAEAQAQLAETKSHQAEATLNAIYQSRSWHLTGPLRHAINLYRRVSSAIHERRVCSGVKRRARPVVVRSMSWVSSKPRIKYIALQVLDKVPSIKGRLRRLAAVQLAPLHGQPEFLFKAPGGDLRLHPRVFPTWPTLPETLLLPALADAPARWVRLTGHVEGHYSLAIVNRGLAGALEQMTEQRLQFVPYHGQPYTELPVLPQAQDAQLHAALRRTMPDEEVGKAISLVHHYPFISDPLPAGLRYILFFWEETSVPADIIAHLNDHFDAVLVAAESVKRTLINSGCRPPVFVIPIGVDHLIPPETEPLSALRVADGQPLRFLHVSSVFERKGADVLLAAYLNAFTADDAVELYIKTFPNPHNQIRDQLELLSAGRERPARVIIDEAPLDDAGMLALYRSAHAMVLPTRGEGFNLPAAEALAMGLPVITTGHSAQADFCSQATATLLRFHVAASRSHLRAMDACWLEPDRGDLSAKLRQLRERILNDDAALEAQRQAGLKHVRDTYTWANSARALLASADWLARQTATEPVPLRVALVSPWGTRCGIAEYSHKLLCALIDQEDVELSVYCDDRTVEGCGAVEPCWRLGDNDSVPGVLDRIGQSNAQVVLMQHQPSLFPLSDACCSQLAALHRQGRVVILELHSTLPLLAECRVSAVAMAALAELDRIIVHKPEDLNHLLALGLVDNVLLLNHGVIQPLAEPGEGDTRAMLGIPAEALVLGCFGFALEHKGIDTLVETIKPLAEASGRPVHLLALNSILDKRSEQMIQQYQALARQLGVDRQITWITDYRPIEECQKLLCAADYIVFPYRHTRESASGAVTIGLATLKPVLVSPLEIFSDLPDVTWRMQGHEAADVLQAISALIARPETTSALRERQLQWLQARDWNTLSTRLLTVMRSLRRERRLADAIAPGRQAWEALWTERRRKQLLVDISEMYYRDARTGIQRVVRSVLNELFLDPPDGYDICPVYGSKTDGFRYTSKFHPGRFCERDEQPVEAGAGDVFLGLDLAAHLFPEAEQHLAAFRLAGARVYYVIYDIIPLRSPQFTVSGISQAFDSWLRGIARHADGLMCISEAVAQDVAGWLSEHAPCDGRPMICHFHLGADIDRSNPTRGLPDTASATLSMLEEDVSFLMVGTIEPRKGHTLVLEAFEQLWAEGQTCRLVLVGKQGWNMDALAEHLHTHPESGRRLIWLESVSDEYLERIYQNSDCLIAASECEGFGLPLIEAAQHKLPIIARDIPVFREVAGEHAYYFGAGSPHELAESVKAWLSLWNAGIHQKSQDMPWLTWKESAAVLMRLIMSKEDARGGCCIDDGRYSPDGGASLK